MCPIEPSKSLHYIFEIFPMFHQTSLMYIQNILNVSTRSPPLCDILSNFWQALQTEKLWQSSYSDANFNAPCSSTSTPLPPKWNIHKIENTNQSFSMQNHWSNSDLYLVTIIWQAVFHFNALAIFAPIYIYHVPFAKLCACKR